MADLTLLVRQCCQFRHRARVLSMASGTCQSGMGICGLRDECFSRGYFAVRAMRRRSGMLAAKCPQLRKNRGCLAMRLLRVWPQFGVTIEAQVALLPSFLVIKQNLRPLARTADGSGMALIATIDNLAVL
jgi:hypothetical protein